MRRLGVWAAVLVSGSLLIAGCDQSGGSGKATTAPQTKEQAAQMAKSKAEEMQKAMQANKGMAVTPGKLPAPGATK
jgi:outer membrane murein-binding lipoprotein Lpp